MWLDRRTGPTPRGSRRGGPALWAWALLCCATASACGSKIGDSCQSNVDCSRNGDRQCDVASPGGYCTVEGCDGTTCPDSATCVRFLSTAFVTKPCGPRAAGAPNVGDGSGCDPVTEICLPSGLCARLDTERRFCMASCGDDGDCRGGYRCRGNDDADSVIIPREAAAQSERYCGPNP